MTKDTGGQAFPIMGTYGKSDSLGLTIRDYFAGQALMGVIASPHRIAGQISETIGKDCYAVADAMIAERGKR